LKKRLVLIILVGLLAIVSSAHSFCFEEAGEMYNINADLLSAIAFVESSHRPDAVNKRNKNGSYDFGLMQINSSWAKKIGHDLWMELDDPCQNVMVGAWILAECIERHGYTWEAVGCYNTPNKSKQKKYIARVKKALDEIVMKE
jgi:soluble lytic murein transglycosylase-like protein